MLLNIALSAPPWFSFVSSCGVLRYRVSEIADHGMSLLERPARVFHGAGLSLQSLGALSSTLTEASFPSPELPKAGYF